MSTLYYNYFLTCYSKEPPTVTKEQLATALSQGKLTQAEYDKIIAVRVETTPIPEDPSTTTEAPPV